jgi:hypothetical protein
LILGGRFVFFLEHGFEDYDVAFVLALEICVADILSRQETVMIGIHTYLLSDPTLKCTDE